MSNQELILLIPHKPNPIEVVCKTSNGVTLPLLFDESDTYPIPMDVDVSAFVEDDATAASIAQVQKSLAERYIVRLQLLNDGVLTLIDAALSPFADDLCLTDLSEFRLFVHSSYMYLP